MCRKSTLEFKTNMKFCQFSQSYKSQFLAALGVNIVSFGHGAVLGWLSPSLPILQSKDSPLATGTLTIEQTSWVGALVCIGAIFGNNMFAIISDRFGRKFALNLLALPSISFWLMIIFGSSYQHLYIARIFAGVTGGGTYCAVPLFIADIAEPKVRGGLCSMFLFAINCGVLISFIVGSFVNYTLFPFIFIPIPIIYTVLVLFMPETPQTLIKAKKLDEARKSYSFYRGVGRNDALPKHYSEEFDSILLKTTSPIEKQEIRLKDFGTKAAIKGLTICFMLMIFNAMSGGFTFMNYAGPIFRDAGSNMSPNTSAIVVAILQIAGTYVSSILVDRIGRKMLLTISLAGIGCGLGILGGYLYLHKQGFDVSKYAILPVICLSFSVFIACLGILTVPFVVMVEVLPSNIRSIGSLVSVIFLSSIGFVVLKFFPILAIQIELYGCMWMFGGTCALGAIYVLLFLPETKGKNLNEPSVIGIENRQEKKSGVS